MIVFRLILLLLLFASPAWSATYYIDYDGGADTNNGTAAGTPFQHCPGDANATDTAAGVTPAAGDIFYFKKGVTYRGQITTTQSGSEVGSGSNATVTAPGVFTAAGENFSTTVSAGDIVYIYNASTTGAWVPSVGFWAVASVDSDTQLTLTGYDGAAHAVGELTYRVWRPITFTSLASFGTGDATLSGKDAEETAVLYFLVRPQGNYIRYSGLKFADTKWPPEYPAASCTQTAWAAIYDNSENVGMIVDNNTFADVWSATNIAGAAPGYFIMAHNTGTNIGYLGFGGSGKGADFIHGNSITGGGSCIRGAGAYSVVSNNTLTECNHSSATYCGLHGDGIGPFFSPSASPGSNEYGWIINNYIIDTVEGIFLEHNNPSADAPYGATRYWTIANNVLVGKAGAGGSGDAAILLDGAPDTKVYNNTIVGYGADGYWGVGIRLADHVTTSTTVDIQNNIISSTASGAGGMINLGSTTAVTGTTSSNNFFYHPNFANAFGIAGVKSWAQWNAAGYDTSGSVDGTDPSLDGDYKPQVTSPTAIKTGGADLSALFTTDKDGDTRIVWGMGAYGYGLDAPAIFTVTSSKAGTGTGTLSFEGADSVASGADSRTYTITPASDSYVILSGTAGATGTFYGETTYQRTNVDADYTIVATFYKKPAPMTGGTLRGGTIYQ